MYGIDIQALEPTYVCSHCQCGLFSDDYMYNGHVLCEKCYMEIRKPETILEFIKAYPDKFTEYLYEVFYSGMTEELDALLEDYKEWREEDFDEWVVN